MTNSGPFLRVYPSADMQESQTVPPSHMMTIGGPVHTHRLARGTTVWQLPLDWVTEADKATIASWWADQRELLLTFNVSESTITTTARVRIINDREPFGTRIMHQDSHYQSILFLQGTTGDGKLPGGPFILNDDTWGVLNQTYNFLT